MNEHLQFINSQSQHTIPSTDAPDYSLRTPILNQQGLCEEGSSDREENSEISIAIDNINNDSNISCEIEERPLSSEDGVHVSSAEESLSDISDDGCNINHSLADWAVKYQITHESLGSLLAILHVQHPDLPKDPRTLLQAVRQYETQDILGGQYYHFGTKEAITQCLKSCSVNSDIQTLAIQINIDGIPLFKSSNMQFWPILGRCVDPFINEPFIIGLFCGNSKPGSISQFLGRFVEEMEAINNDGLDIEGFNHRLTLNISCFVCDAPARAFVKQVKGHNAYYGCEKCIQKGVWLGKVTHPLVGAPVRTDDNFREMTFEEHHSGESPLKRISIGMVTQFPLDPMHLVYLGVVKKIITLWLKGPIGNGCRIGTNASRQISDCLKNFRVFCPQEFARKPRSLFELDRWKATEFRTFLLYAGPVAIKNIIPGTFYRNFLLLFVGIFCLENPWLWQTHCQYAKEILCLFVTEFAGLYGKDMLVYNVHGLTHLADDALKFGPLSTFSAFPFESFLGRIKKMIRKPNFPLQQVIRRLSEQKCREHIPPKVVDISLKGEHNLGPLPGAFAHYTQYKEVKCKDVFLSCELGNNCIKVGSRFGLIKNILSVNEKEFTEPLIVYQGLGGICDFFTDRLPSSSLGIVEVSQHPIDTLHTVPLSQVCKNVMFPYKESRYVIIPLLHMA